MLPVADITFFGITFVGLNSQNLGKLLLTVALLAILGLLGRLARTLFRRLWREHPNERARFWTRQGISLITIALFLLGAASIWFPDPTTLTTALGLISAGLAFALQQVITAIAGYFVILRGEMFNVGDRITMGGVRGDVIGLSFIKTTIMEMGQPASVQVADPAVWIKSRQFTGRIVTVSNAKIFDEPVYNYTRDFPYIWDEIVIPITYTADRDRAEQILLDCANRHMVHRDEISDLTATVYYRITDNWLELTVRFLGRDHGMRAVKDAMSRDILKGLDAANIGIASATYDIVGLPTVRWRDEDRAPRQERQS